MKLTLREGMSIEPITEINQKTYDNLSQVYEMEFSNQTNFDPDFDGHYPIASPCPDGGVTLGWILRDEKKYPAGFVIVRKRGEYWDINEFFIAHKYRRQGVGAEFAATVMQMFPGPWQLRELLTSPWATPFWEHCLAKMGCSYVEEAVPDEEWSTVIRQTFFVA